jgi:ubiquinone/menaquinone biosynthesis C-methylase UbiE
MAKSSDEIAAAYDSPSWWYDLRGYCILRLSYRSTIMNQLRFFSQYMGPRHLEAACGSGTLLKMILWWRRWKKMPRIQIVAFDYAPAMLAGAQRNFARNPQVELRLADAGALPFPDESFDTLSIANALHSLPDCRAALREFNRVLKRGGTFSANVIRAPQGGWPWKGIAEWLVAWGKRKGILTSTYEPDIVDQLLQESGFQKISGTLAGNSYNVRATKQPAKSS